MRAPPQPHRVFVYGTLRRGHRNHYRLEAEGRAYDRKVTDVCEGGHKVQAHIYVGVAGYWHHRHLPAWTVQNKRGELEWARS